MAIPLGGYHWIREALKELFTEHEVGIDLLMLGATAGSGFLGLWDEADLLVFLYGAAEGLEEYTYPHPLGDPGSSGIILWLGGIVFLDWLFAKGIEAHKGVMFFVH